MLTGPFLTDIDPRRAVKGSRDPLGMMAIWNRMGRYVVGNLTTVTTSVRDFTICALGFTLIERLLESGHEESELPIFLRWEQLCSYARAEKNGEHGFRGTERVHRTLSDGDPVVLSADRGHQILSNQKTYGIWGLFTVASRASALLDDERLRPSAYTKEHAERVWWPLICKALGGDGSRLADFIARPHASLDVRGRDAGLLALVATLIGPRLKAAEREFYTTHLAHGGPLPERDRTSGRQRQLADLFREGKLAADAPLSPSVVAGFAKEARAIHGRVSELADRLEAIRTCELTLAPASRLFDWLQTQHDRDLSDTARQIQKQWGARVATVDADGLRALNADIASATGSADVASRWQRIADAMSAGDYLALVESLLEHNRWIMQTRDGASPWIEVRAGKLHVRFHEAGDELPSKEELRTLWRNPYFINSLRSMVATLGDGN